ncbi:hypothetical protein CMO88_04055 [Candidatus Woesearchaeota archaeon]|nr:hypothetical protein [Candidatus Woesearchaeota archaeon]|tara:strand:- start:27587 stop:28012 length:426 start_codon:yes stop_codon:yes gene_type:complete
MSLATVITRTLFGAAAAGILYATVGGALPFNKSDLQIESGFANPKYGALDTPVNENGNSEYFYNYDDGLIKVTLPIVDGPFGPLVGDSDYHWRSMDVETKSKLVDENWNDLQIETRKSILSNELETMIENYRGVSNGRTEN